MGLGPTTQEESYGYPSNLAKYNPIMSALHFKSQIRLDTFSNKEESNTTSNLL